MEDDDDDEEELADNQPKESSALRIFPLLAVYCSVGNSTHFSQSVVEPISHGRSGGRGGASQAAQALLLLPLLVMGSTLRQRMPLQR